MQQEISLPHPLAARQSLFLSTNGQPLTTSRAVAQRFGKLHKNVLADIDQHIRRADGLVGFVQRNFMHAGFCGGDQIKGSFHCDLSGKRRNSSRYLRTTPLASSTLTPMGIPWPTLWVTVQ